jgi:alkyl hydroperoxide reductase subunit F
MSDVVATCSTTRTTSTRGRIIIAAGDGAKAALGAFDYLVRSSAPAA